LKFVFFLASVSWFNLLFLFWFWKERKKKLSSNL
jgi:hypothetical protein